MNQQPALKQLNQQLNDQLDFKPHENQLLDHLKNYLNLANNYLVEEFKNKTNVRQLVQVRAQHMDNMLINLWQHLTNNSAWLSSKTDAVDTQQEYALIAVGGYGRGELHPYSDIDLLILSRQNLSQAQQDDVAKFIALLWDCHLKISQSVRNFSQCLTLAKQELSVVTNLMESRLLVGDKVLYNELRQAIAPDKLWSVQEFYHAKLSEKRSRYQKYNSSSFDLEPDIKSSPGGLRDIQLIAWIAQRAYYPLTITQLLKQQILRKEEFNSLMKCQLFLWKIRFALHLVAQKPEDRLLFDYQKTTAKIMGYKDSKKSLGVEKMMKQYYRSVLIVRNISDMLLQLLEKAFFADQSSEKIINIDQNFQIVNQRIEIVDAKLFLSKPSLLLKIFQHLALDPSIKGIGVSTLRAMRAARQKITPKFRKSTKNRALFIGFWHIMHTSSRAMFAMKRNGILADYLEPFKQITGQMQYDMFHSYTVDEHTLFLLKNLTQFANPEFNKTFPLCSEIMQRQKKPEIIFLAGLFHDIAKGRGGDHSELGAQEVNRFCKAHKMTEEDTKTIEWLVANHLLMSLTAQKRDISDPKVIKNFAALVVNTKQLELLYILTVADIIATSNKLWNSWKDALLKQLYLSTLKYLADDQSNLDEVWKTNKNQARKQLLSLGFEQQAIDCLWQHLESSYFAKRTAKSICWQTELILNNQQKASPLVAIRTLTQTAGNEIFVYTVDQENLFAKLTATLNQQGLNIQAASIYTTKDGFCYDSFYVLKDNDEAYLNSREIKTIQKAVRQVINQSDEADIIVRKRIPRQFKYFSVKTTIKFYADEYSGLTRLEVTTADRPGLLAAIGEAFKQTKSKIHDARITTLGEKVEDTFIISNYNDQPIDDKQQREIIRKKIIQQLKTIR